MPRLLVVAFAFLLSLTIQLGAPPAQVAAQDGTGSPAPRFTGQAQIDADQPDADSAAEAARQLSRLEAARDFDALYDLLHPDSKVLAPRAAVVGWYGAQLAGKTTAELTVTDVAFVDWTWGVTGRTYPNTAEISVVQPYWTDGVRTDVDNVIHLVRDGDTWRWFFGASKEFVDQQIALYDPQGNQVAAAPATGGDPAAAVAAGEAERAVTFPDPLDADIDRFWAYQFAAAGRAYDPPNGVVGFDQPIQTACGEADPATEAAFYCVLDQTIYYSVDFRRAVESRIGDFGWIVVVAHEWGHHVQVLLGTDLTGNTLDVNGDVAPIEIEQQADCAAGAYTKDADGRGWLDQGDVDEALQMTRISGDPPGTAWTDPFAHGSGADRVSAFLSGYDGGLAACHFDLSGQ